MTFLTQIQNYWPVIIFIGGGIIWFSKLEFKTITMAKDIEAMQNSNSIRDKESDGFREKILITLENLTVNMEYVKKTLEELKKK